MHHYRYNISYISYQNRKDIYHCVRFFQCLTVYLLVMTKNVSLIDSVRERTMAGLLTLDPYKVSFTPSNATVPFVFLLGKSGRFSGLPLSVKFDISI
jgi:hypothetical protein